MVRKPPFTTTVTDMLWLCIVSSYKVAEFVLRPSRIGWRPCLLLWPEWIYTCFTSEFILQTFHVRDKEVLLINYSDSDSEISQLVSEIRTTELHSSCSGIGLLLIDSLHEPLKWKLDRFSSIIKVILLPNTCALLTSI